MKKPILIGAFLAVILVLTIAGTKISRLTETTTLPTAGGSIFVVVTGTTDKATRYIQDTNLISALSQLPNWTGGGGGGGASTNANQFGAAGSILTLKSGVRTTNGVQYGITTNAGSATRIRGDNDPFLEITSITLPQTFYAKSTGIGTRSGGGQAYLSFYPEETLTIEMATDVMRPANGSSISLGVQDTRPFLDGWYSRTVGTSNILLGPVVRMHFGNASPEGIVSANPQSLYFQTNQTTGIGLWIKTNGTSSAGWWLLTPGGGGGGLSDGDKGDITISASASNWQIDPGAVGFPELVDASVSQRIIARNTAGSGNFQEVRIGQILDWLGVAGVGTQGEILYRNGTHWTNLPPGTSGQLLQTPGPGGNPLWATVGTLTDSDKTDITVSGSGTIFTVDPGAITGAKLAPGIFSTNSFYTNAPVAYSKNLQNARNEFWDDFDGPDMDAVAFKLRRSPSGHTYRLHSADPEGTNGFRMTGGKLVQTNRLDTPFYLSVSNTAPSFVRPWNRFGAVISWRSNAVPTTFIGEFGLINISHAILGAHSGDYLHTYTDINGTPVVQRSLTENLLSEDNGSGALGAGTYHDQGRVMYEINVFSNSMTLQIGGYLQSIYYTNLAAFTRWPVVMWELFGSGTNEVQPEIESIWAGYADPALEILANGPRKLGTNYSEITEVTRGTLVGANGGAAGGTYTNKNQDTIIAIGPGLSVAGTARTNKLYHHNNTFGKRVLIFDESGSAEGSNIVIQTMDGALIRPGNATSTNIAENFGSMELIRTTNGWNVVAGPRSSSGNVNQFDSSGLLDIISGAVLSNIVNWGTYEVTGAQTNRSTLGIAGTSYHNGQATFNDTVFANGAPTSIFALAAANANIGRFTNTLLSIGNSVLGSAVVTNTFRMLATNLAFPSGTNLIASGAIGNYFTNAIDGRTAGITNIVVTNILDGQTITIDVFANNGTQVQLCTAPAVQIPDAWYFDGVAIAVNTNGFSRIIVSRYGGWTNVNVLTPSFAFQAGPAQTDSTNFATRVITRLLTAALTNLAGVSQYFTNGQASSMVLSNLVGTVANNVTNEGSAQLQITSGTIGLQSGSFFEQLANSSLSVPAPNIVSNVTAMKWNVWTNYSPAQTNFLISFNTNRYELKNQTNIWFTNIVEEATAVGADVAIHVHNTTANTIPITWPSYGAQHGYFFQTNINNPILTSTTLTTGKHGVASFTAFGTNIFATWTEWP